MLDLHNYGWRSSCGVACVGLHHSFVRALTVGGHFEQVDRLQLPRLSLGFLGVIGFSGFLGSMVFLNPILSSDRALRRGSSGEHISFVYARVPLV